MNPCFVLVVIPDVSFEGSFPLGWGKPRQNNWLPEPNGPCKLQIRLSKAVSTQTKPPAESGVSTIVYTLYWLAYQKSRRLEDSILTFDTAFNSELVGRFRCLSLGGHQGFVSSNPFPGHFHTSHGQRHRNDIANATLWLIWADMALMSDF